MTGAAPRFLVAFALGAVTLARPANVVHAQDVGLPTDGPPSYTEALDLLERGDTAAAIEDLRAATEEAPDFGPAFLRLGAVLAAESTELDIDWKKRKVAMAALKEAWRLMGDDPEVLLRYGLLLKKQGIRVDAKRVLERAWKTARARGDSLDPKLRAELHWTLGRIYERWREDFRNLVDIPPSAQQITCTAAAAATFGEPTMGQKDRSVMCPRQWAEQLNGVVPIADLRSEDRERMIEHFRLALAADSTRTDVGITLLGYLADSEVWGEYLRVARWLVRSNPRDARAHVFLGLGLHERGLDTHADTAFATALALLKPGERRAFDDVSPLLTRAGAKLYAGMDSAERRDAARVFFASSDPSFLTDVEERQLEHYARVAWAELKFGEPTTGQRGWDSEIGQIWIRYGRPWKRYQCCYGLRPRFIYWSYGEDGPVFVFYGQPVYLMTDLSKQVADQLAATVPEFYKPNTVTASYGILHQLARFRGGEPELTRVEIYGAVPLDSLGAGPGTSLDAGIFVFDPSYHPLWKKVSSLKIGDTAVGLSYQLELGPGEYRYGLEARRAGIESQARPIARARERLEVEGFPAGQLALSDILVADAIQPVETPVTTRKGLRIAPSRTLEFAPGAPIAIYFEIYGLTLDEEGAARYRVEMSVEGAERKNLIARVASGLVELFRGGGDREPRAAWDRVVRVKDDRALEYLSIDLGTRDPGQYRISVKVTDRATGAAATAERRFHVSEETRGDRSG